MSPRERSEPAADERGRDERRPLLSTLLLPREMLVRRMRRRPAEGGGKSVERRLAMALLVAGGLAGVVMAFVTGP